MTTPLEKFITAIGGDKATSFLSHGGLLNEIDTYFPSINGKDLYFKERCWFLEVDPSLFIMVGKNVERVEDLRLLSSATLEGMQVRKWKPWRVLKEEWKRLVEAPYWHRFVYRLLSLNYKKKPSPTADYKNFLFVVNDNNSISKKKFLAALVEAELGQQQMEHKNFAHLFKEFFAAYPTLSYLLLLSPRNFHFSLAGEHQAVEKLVAHHYTSSDLWKYGNLAANERILSMLPLKERALREVCEYYSYGNGAREPLLCWLAMNSEDEKVRTNVMEGRCVEILKRIPNIEKYAERMLEKAILHDLYEVGAYLVQFAHPPHSLCAHIANSEKWSSILPGYTHRWCEGKDMFELAIDQHNLTFVEALVAVKEDIVKPIERQNYVRTHPLLYAYAEYLPMAQYLYPIYGMKKEEILRLALLYSPSLKNVLKNIDFSCKDMLGAIVRAENRNAIHYDLI